MDTSNSAAPESNVASYRVVDTLSEQTQAIDALLALARSSVRVFDRDLAQGDWNTARRADLLAACLRTHDARLQIIVHDTRHLETACPRIRALLRTYGTAMTIYRTGPEASAAMDPLLIVDERHFVHRFHVDQPRAAIGIDQPTLAKPLVGRFDEIWMTGEPGLAADVLGL